VIIFVGSVTVPTPTIAYTVHTDNYTNGHLILLSFFIAIR